jgi:serine/threonine protein kinase
VSQFGEWKYTPSEPLGKGSFGEVREVVRNAPGTRIPQLGALKLVKQKLNEQQRTTLENEIASYAKLSSPFVPAFYEAGWNEEKGPWLVVARIHGKSLMEIVEETGPISRPQWLELADNILSALVDVHKVGLTHLDIWMPNVMHLSSGHWMLIDFGLTIKEFDPVLTQNWAWGAPEQYSPDTLPGPAADIFALGNTLYFALTGRNPYQGYEQLPYFEAVKHFAPQLTEVDQDIREFLAQMFNIRPQARPTASKLLENLSVLQGSKSVPRANGVSIEYWAQLAELVADSADYMTDFSVELTQSQELSVSINFVAEDDGFRVGLPSEKVLGKTLSVNGRANMHQIGMSVDSQGNFTKRKLVSPEELPEMVISLARDGLELSLANLTYKIVR